jgi:hypothetical protein
MKMDDKGLLDTCPSCGQNDLRAVCSVIVEYDIAGDGDEQDWLRRDVDDDTSKVNYIRCAGCGAKFTDFSLNDDGFLVGLGTDITTLADTPKES